MIVTTKGIVLSKKIVSEYDAVSVVYTEEFGKVPVRFTGVLRPKGKLKALSEPLVWGDFRLYLKSQSEYARGIGGQVLSAFPGLRSDLSKICQALQACDLTSKLTPAHQKNPEKYSLLLEFLSAADTQPVSYPGFPAHFALAFSIRLLDLAGFGLSLDHPHLGALSKADWKELAEYPFHEEELDFLRFKVEEKLYDYVSGNNLKPQKVLDEARLSLASSL